ncbi:DUF547 domain-containing protein [Cognatitamlana onchidii]|uniref:DUF547 domain-containing protein n=1 Tax=Cognatitamlana onchidii TaxID=2562860 RepID=UPI0010A69C13|nr:DUF547 domain-containing protein [Algibacter onchidii]
MIYRTLLVITLIIFYSCGSTKELTTKGPEQELPQDKPIDSSSNKLETPLEPVNEIPLSPKPPNPLEKKSSKDSGPLSFNHNLWDGLLQKYVSNTGKVNYSGFKTEKTQLHAYLNALSQNMPNDSWSKQAILAYWINAYNAMTIDLILRYYPIKSIKDIKKPWEQRHWELAGKWHNLNEIEHAILRKMDDPRIHFAIVCAAVSCPKLSNKAYVETQLDDQLNNAAKVFLNDRSKNELSPTKLELSKIFQWFSKDFKQNGSLVDFLNQYSKSPISEKAKKTFKNYNWDLNN